MSNLNTGAAVSAPACCRHLAGIAAQRNYGRMDWSVLDWNQRAIDFYEKHGATVMQEWRIVRTDQDGIENLAGGAS